MQKSATFTAILFFLLVQASQGQISVGFRGGLLLTNVDKSPLEQNEPTPENLTSFQLAVPFEIGLGQVFAIQPELMLGSHGAFQEATTITEQPGVKTTTYFKSKYQVAAFEIPVLAKLKLGTEHFKVHVLAGPSIGFGLNGTLKQESKITIESILGNLVDESAGDYKAKFVGDNYDPKTLKGNEFAVSKVNLNLHLGAGLSFQIGGPWVTLEARYMAGLSDLRPESSDETTNYTYTSKRLGISVGLMFPL